MRVFLSSFFVSMFLVSVSGAHTLQDVQKIASDSLRVNEVRSRVAAENMANAKSAGYEPKSIEVAAHKKGLSGSGETVSVKSIKKDQNRVVQEYSPSHPQADENGYVKMPEVNPLIELMNMQESRHSSERALKVYETATDMRHKLISIMSAR
jgi:flagellar basal-body rod protein FlgC